MPDKMIYKPFSRYILRTPIFPLNYVDDRQNVFDSDVFKEAIYLASLELYEGTQSSNAKKQQKFKESNLKYLNRACTRCTPFGLFAGCSIGTISETTEIELQPIEKYRRITRLDMQYLCALIQQIERVPEIRRQLKFYPNDSLYKIGGKYRYVEYHYQKAQRIHNTVSIEIDEPLESLLRTAKDGATIGKLVELLAVDGICCEEAIAYVEDVINSQILQSDLTPCVIGDDALASLIHKLSGLESQSMLKPLQQIQGLLKKIDSHSVGESIHLYTQVIDVIKTLNVDYDVKYLFQTDLFKPARTIKISNKITDEISQLIAFLSKISIPEENRNLLSFISVPLKLGRVKN